jgi:hypothetical protein
VKNLALVLVGVFCTSFSQGQFNTQLEFNGFDSHVLVYHHDALNMENSLTVEVRVWSENYDPG